MSSSTKPAASFADTLREQDELFYTAFPQALTGNCTHDPDPLNSASIQDDNSPPSDKGWLAYTPQSLFPQLSPSQSWSRGHWNPQQYVSGFLTHSAFYGDAKSSNSPLTPHKTVTSGASQHFGMQGKMSVSGFLAETNIDLVDSQTTASNQYTSKSLSFRQDEQAQVDKRPSRSKPSKHDADRKPILACLFCRGRKIACGPPTAGTGEKTCRQCLRRSLTCVYPSGSRRGMRKKKDGSNVSND